MAICLAVYFRISSRFGTEFAPWDLSTNWPAVLLPRSDTLIDINFFLPSKEPEFPKKVNFVVYMYVNGVYLNREFQKLWQLI